MHEIHCVHQHACMNISICAISLMYILHISYILYMTWHHIDITHLQLVGQRRRKTRSTKRMAAPQSLRVHEKIQTDRTDKLLADVRYFFTLHFGRWLPVRQIFKNIKIQQYHDTERFG